MTNLGDIEESVWYQLAEHLITRSGEEWLLEALIQWGKGYSSAKVSPVKIRQEAMRLHISRIFDCPTWVCFVPFNRQYRPEVLERAHLVTVIHACCQQASEVTQEQIDRAYNDTVYCTHCGCWSSYTIQPANSTGG